MSDNIYFNLGDVEFIGGVKVKNSTYTLDEFHDILNSSKSIITNSSDVLEWSNTTTYKKDNIVVYKGVLYVSLVDDNLNYAPASYDTWWKKYGSDDSIEQVNTINEQSGDVNIVEGPGISVTQTGKTIIISNTNVGKTLDIPITKNNYTGTTYSYKWTGNFCEVQHNLGGRVFAQIYDENNSGSLLVANYVSDNVVNIEFTDTLKTQLNTSGTYHLLLGINKSTDAAASSTGNVNSTNDVSILSSKTLTLQGQTQINLITSAIKLNGYSANTTGGLVTVQTGNKLPALDGSLLTNLPSTTNVVVGQGLSGNGTSTNPLNITIGDGLKKDSTGVSLDISNYISTDSIILNYNNQSYVSAKTGGLTLFSTDKVNLNTNDLRLNNKAVNTAGGLVQLNTNGKIDQSLIQFDSATSQLINWGEESSDKLTKLTNLINSYDYFMSYLANNFEVKEVYCTMSLTTQGGNITQDTSNKDNDAETAYLYEVDGYVLGVESYVTNQDTQMKRFFPDISYDKSVGDYGRSYIYFSEVEYVTIHELLSPKNKVKIQYVQLKTNQ